MTTEVPAPVAAESVAEFSDEVDVLVAGFGIAGGCVAVEAARAGARVLVLERGGPGGSTTAMAGGHFYLGGGTPVQTATGHEDSPDEMFAYLEAVSRHPDREKLRLYCDDSVEHFEWLEGIGLHFERSYYPGKATIQPGTEGLMYTGNEKVWPFRDIAKPAPRGHKVPRPGDTGGGKFVVELLAAELERLGVEVRHETGVTELVTNGGAVSGARWKRFDETGAVRARSVVLAAGGFVSNPDMVAKYSPRLSSIAMVLGGTFDDGLGIRLGMSVGGALSDMDGAHITAPFYPPSSLVNGIIVNAEGKRFVSEDSYHARTSDAVYNQPDRVAYLIADSKSMGMPQYGLTPFIDGWESVEDMERGLNLPAGALVKTLAEYNRHAAAGEDPEFHKHPDWLRPQDTGPWGAFQLTPGKAHYVGFSLGGLCTSADGEVLSESGERIGGLYAAGAGASNIAQDGAGYASGIQLGEGSYFGRRAGRHAARP